MMEEIETVTLLEGAGTEEGSPMGVWKKAAICLVLTSGAARAQTLAPEDKLRQVFVVSFYSAAFGAAFGAALLPFFPEPPVANMRFIAGGASLGFILGSAYAFAAGSPLRGGDYYSERVPPPSPFALVSKKAQQRAFSLGVPVPQVGAGGVALPLAHVEL